MKKKLIFPLLLILIAGCSKTDPTYVTEIENWQAQRLERLKSKSGWLNLAGLFWLEEGENTIGSDSSNSIVFPENAPAFCGTIINEGGNISIKCELKDSVFVDNEVTDDSPLLSDEKGKPSICSTGNFEWFIIKRDDKYGIRLRDFAHPRISALDHIPSFPVDSRWKKTAKFIPYSEPDTIMVGTMIGGTEAYTVPGRLVFRHHLKKYEILPFSSGKGFFLIIGDKTSAVETYGAGRFMYVEGPDEKNRLVLDFNKAYNPPCAFSPFATCPLPPPENRLDLRITAGEKAVHLD